MNTNLKDSDYLNNASALALGFVEYNGYFYLYIGKEVNLCYLPDRVLLMAQIGNKQINYPTPTLRELNYIHYTLTRKFMEGISRI